MKGRIEMIYKLVLYLSCAHFSHIQVTSVVHITNLYHPLMHGYHIIKLITLLYQQIVPTIVMHSDFKTISLILRPTIQDNQGHNWVNITDIL